MQENRHRQESKPAQLSAPGLHGAPRR
ncbi:MAG: hypothetical protein ACJA2W_001395 [Planctomycetota bacterium]